MGPDVRMVLELHEKWVAASDILRDCAREGLVGACLRLPDIPRCSREGVIGRRAVVTGVMHSSRAVWLVVAIERADGAGVRKGTMNIRLRDARGCFVSPELPSEQLALPVARTERAAVLDFDLAAVQADR